MDREFQLRVVRRLAGFSFFYLVLFLGVAVTLPAILTALGFSGQWALWSQASREFRTAVLVNLVGMPLLCTFVVLFLHGIRETFRIAGPKYRFEQIFQQVEGLTIPRGIRVRKTDYMQDTAQALDRSLISLHEVVTELKSQSRDASRYLREARSSENVRQSLEEAEQAVARVEHVLSRFELLDASGAPIPDPSSAGPAVDVVEPLPERQATAVASSTP